MPGSQRSGSADLDEQFVASWREELLSRAWAALARDQAETGRPFHTLLRLRTDHAESSTAELASLFSRSHSKVVDSNWLRVNLHRARDLFVELLMKEVTASLKDPDPERVEQELMELGLYEHCRSSLKRRGYFS